MSQKKTKVVYVLERIVKDEADFKGKELTLNIIRLYEKVKQDRICAKYYKMVQENGLETYYSTNNHKFATRASQLFRGYPIISPREQLKKRRAKRKTNHTHSFGPATLGTLLRDRAIPEVYGNDVSKTFYQRLSRQYKDNPRLSRFLVNNSSRVRPGKAPQVTEALIKLLKQRKKAEESNKGSK